MGASETHSRRKKSKAPGGNRGHRLSETRLRENRGATQQEVVEQRAEADGGRLVVNVALDDITRRGPLSQALEQSYNLRRRTG